MAHEVMATVIPGMARAIQQIYGTFQEIVIFYNPHKRESELLALVSCVVCPNAVCWSEIPQIIIESQKVNDINFI